MNRLLHICLVAACIALPAPSAAAVLSTVSSAPAGSEYTLTVIPYYSPEKIWTKFSPFIEHLRNATGLPWQLKLYHNHEAVIDGLCSGEVSFALLGPVPLGRAHDRCEAGIIAVALGKDGKPFYRSVIVTSDDAVRSIADLRNKRIGLFRGSTAAHIIPLKMLRDGGIAEAELASVFYESQDRIMNALLDREVSGAGVKESLYLRFRGRPLRALKSSAPLPGFAVASAPAVRPAVAKRLADALIRLDPRKNPDDRRLMQDWDDEIRNGFIRPPTEFRASVLSILSVYREIMHEDR